MMAVLFLSRLWNGLKDVFMMGYRLSRHPGKSEKEMPRQGGVGDSSAVQEGREVENSGGGVK